MRGRLGVIATVLIWLVASALSIALALQRFSEAAFDAQPDLTGFFLPAARAIVVGESPYTVAGYFYSPLVALLLAPFADLSRTTSM
jgi:uncharacterized SAM-binding protein YcdF (DUF218 family)